MDELLKRLQEVLREGGVYTGKPDGVYGPLTEAALHTVIDNKGVLPKEAPPWVLELRKVFGLHEIRDNAALKEWLISDGKTLGDPRVLPWCGDAMATAIVRSLPDEKLKGAVAENPYWALNWAGFGQGVAPTLWSIGVFKRADGGHVGVLVSQSQDSYHVLGGNQGDSVSLVSIPKRNLVAARWPLTYPQGFARPLPFAVAPNQASLA